MHDVVFLFARSPPLCRFVYSESMPSMLDKLTPTAFARTYLTSPQFATLYYKTAADVARRKSKLADARTEQDALLSRLDKKKLSFKLVVCAL